jgi:hypothetical protein
MSLKKRKLLWTVVAALLVLVATAVMREFGVLQVTLYRTTFTSEVEVWKWYDRESPDKLILSDKVRAASTKTITDKREWNLGFHFPPERGRASFEQTLNEGLERKFGGGVEQRVYVLRTEITGLDWMPFVKRGSCSYGLGWQHRKVEGEGRVLSGEIDFNVRGLLSQRDLEEILAKLIVDEAVKIDSGG